MTLETALWTPVRSRWRFALAGAAGASSLAHVPVIGPHLEEAPYMGLEFIVLTAACASLAAAAVLCDSAAVYLLTMATCSMAILGYAATRLTAFPQLGGDVGDWFEPLGVVSVLAEAAAVGVAAAGLHASARRRSR